MMKAGELRARTDAELRNELLEMRREEFNLRMQKGIGQLSRPSQVRLLRRDIARLKTVWTERTKT